MKSHSVLGMRLDHVTPAQGLEIVAERASKGQAGYCCVPNVHMCIEAVDDPKFRTIVNSAALNWSDSTILQKARSLRFEAPMLPVMKGADMMLELLEAAAQKDIAVGLYGASKQTIKRLQKKLPEQFPGLKLTYAFSPPFRPLSPVEEGEVISNIKQANVQLLLVGLGCPKQERWMAQHTNQLPDTMMIGIGAAFDFNAGTVKPSPAFVHKYGLEWLYRLVSEPRRLARRYLTTSPRFIALLAIDALKARRPRKTHAN